MRCFCASRALPSTFASLHYQRELTRRQAALCFITSSLSRCSWWLAGKTEHTHSLPHPRPSLSAFSSSAPFCSCVLSHCSRAADEVEDPTRREGRRARGKARVTVGAATICRYETARTARRGCVSGAAKCTGPNPPSSCRHFLFLLLFGSLLLCVFTCVCVCVCVSQVTSVLNVHLAMLQLSLRPSFTLRASSGEPFFCCFVLRQKTPLVPPTLCGRVFSQFSCCED